MYGNQSHYEQLSRDLYISAIGTSGGLPAICLGGSQIQDGCKVSVMGTNYDQYQSHYKLVLYRCDPTFMQSPARFAKKESGVSQGAVMEEKQVQYLASLGVMLEDERAHEGVNMFSEGKGNWKVKEEAIQGKISSPAICNNAMVTMN